MPVRYSITCLGQPGAKKRLRLLLGVAGMESVRIVEKEQEATAVPPRPDNLPTSDAAKAVAALFKRKPHEEWMDDEIAAFKAAVKTGLLTLENMTIVSAFYSTETKREGNFCRTSITTFCRHFGSELSKARAVKPSRGKALEWSPPANVVPMQDEAEQERIRAKVRELAAARKAQSAEVIRRAQ